MEDTKSTSTASEKSGKKLPSCMREKFDKVAYQREYMRKRRAKQKEEPVSEATVEGLR